MLKNVVPYVGTKSLLMQFLHRGVTLPMLWQVDILWSGCEFTNEDPKDSMNWMKIQCKEFQVWVKKINLSTNTLKCRCACPDEYFTWAWQGWQQGYLFGSKPKRYVRKTRHYPPRNPHNYAGMCKHIAKSIVFAQRSGWVSENVQMF